MDMLSACPGPYSPALQIHTGLSRGSNPGSETGYARQAIEKIGLTSPATNCLSTLTLNGATKLTRLTPVATPAGATTTSEKLEAQIEGKDRVLPSVTLERYGRLSCIPFSEH